MRLLMKDRSRGTNHLRDAVHVYPNEEIVGIVLDDGKTVIETGPDEKSVKISSEFDLTIEPRSSNLIDIRTGGPEE